MTEKKKAALSVIEEKKDMIFDVSDKIWDFAELSLAEYRSCDLYCDVLEKEGFEVEKGICTIPTAFSGSYGSGRPVIGILAEYDALSGLSQQAGALKKKDREDEDASPNGHGCGHNLLGAGALGAAIGIKRFLEGRNGQGTVILYGCPGEEGCASKAFMARDGEWKKLDAALTWHPSDCNEVVTGSSNSCIQVSYTFKGIASHASGAPEKGRSALDAVELMNIGVQFLREHMSDRARVHYAITDTGGVSPNVVQPRAQVLYMVRSNHVSEAVELQKRVDKIAEGAALMTETEYERQFVDGLSDTVTNRALEDVMYRNFEEIGAPSYTGEELEYVGKLSETYEGNDRAPGIGSAFDSEYAQEALNLRSRTQAMNDFLLPHFGGDAFEPGSTDVGDVSWLCPTAQIHVASWPNGCPGHSWQNVALGKTSIAHKSVLCAAKVICASAIDLFEDEELIKKAEKEFELRTKSGYCCPIPSGAVAKPL
ncbi:MAG: amidohydrolase [Butyrivibrio sp.]|nr:amidohydrolase [Butyrivibrio sp.]